PAIVLGRSGWWQQQPLRFFSISGDVANPGVFEVPFTRTTLGDLIQLAGGMRDNQSLQAVAPSGPSEGFLPAQLRLPALLKDILTDRKIADVASRSPHAEAWVRDFRARRGDCRTIDVRELLLDKQLFMALGFNLGAGIVVYDARVDLLQAARNCLRFF